MQLVGIVDGERAGDGHEKTVDHADDHAATGPNFGVAIFICQGRDKGNFKHHRVL